VKQAKGFRVGQIVRFTPGTHERAYGGLYQVVAGLPEERGERQYRLKSTKDSHERIVRESQISNPADEQHSRDGSERSGVNAAELLSAAEQASLHQLAKGNAAVSIPIGHLARFRHLGLTKPTAVGEALTKKGKDEARRKAQAES
jgi:hypothetical protein